MARVTISPTPSATTEPTAVDRGGRLKALLWSPDFIIGILLGSTLALIPALIPSVVPNGFGFFVSLAAISAGVAALVLTPMTLLISALTPGLTKLLKRVPGGPAETFIPFAQVAAIAALACAASLLVAIVTPLAPLTFPWVIWLAVAVPTTLFLWALLGCVQVTFYLIGMFRTSHQIEELEARANAAREARAQRDGARNQIKS